MFSAGALCEQQVGWLISMPKIQKVNAINLFRVIIWWEMHYDWASNRKISTAWVNIIKASSLHLPASIDIPICVDASLLRPVRMPRNTVDCQHWNYHYYNFERLLFVLSYHTHQTWGRTRILGATIKCLFQYKSTWLIFTSREANPSLGGLFPKLLWNLHAVIYTFRCRHGELTGQFGSATVKVFIIRKQPNNVEVGPL